MAAHTINLAIPSLSSEDYAAFCRLCIGLPPTHSEWQLNQRQYHRRHRRSGHELVPVPIGLTEFQEYCVREHCSPTADALYCLAEDKESRDLKDNGIGNSNMHD